MSQDSSVSDDVSEENLSALLEMSDTVAVKGNLLRSMIAEIRRRRAAPRETPTLPTTQSDDLKRIAALESALRRLHGAAATAVVVLRGHDDDASYKLYGHVYAARATLESRPTPSGSVSLGVASNEQERDGERSSGVEPAVSGASEAAPPSSSDPAVEAYYAARDVYNRAPADTLEESDADLGLHMAADVLAARVEALRAENARAGRIADQLRNDLETERARYAAMALKHQSAEARALKAEREAEEARRLAEKWRNRGEPNEADYTLPWEATPSEGDQKS